MRIQLASVILLGASLSFGISFDFTARVNEVSIETVLEAEETVHLLILPGCISSEELQPPGTPVIPCRVESFILPPGTQADSVLVTSEEWEPLEGFFNLPQVQFTAFESGGILPRESAIYSPSTSFPANPGGILRQGSAMGYNIVTLYGYPLRYIPSEGRVEVLVSADIQLLTSPSETTALHPARESKWSSQIRMSGVESLVSNPEEVSFYSQAEQVSFQNRTTTLDITEFPSLQGDCADMVIVTTEALEGSFQEVADYRTSHGIVTTVRTVEWIDTHYSGCDTQERIRNFLIDAHVSWGIQAVLLGGDTSVVPVRETGGWDYVPVPYPAYQLPSDDYYGDLDGDWSYDGSVWRVQANLGYLDICTGRWPVNSTDDVESMLGKLLLYECPQPSPQNFARRILLMGSNNPAGSGADDLMVLADQLRDHAVPGYLDDPVELYYPHDLPQGDLNRNNALSEFDTGYNLIIHSGHSEIHKLGTAGNGTLGQYMWDSDFATMGNTDQPSILWTLGCDAGHFDGAFCFSEAGLVTSGETGLIASISNARGGMHNQITTAYIFCDALFNTGYTAELFQRQSLNWPLSYLGEAYRTSKNLSGYSFIYLNLLGSPLMNVWRGDPLQLTVSSPQTFVTEGAETDITAFVTDISGPVENASVCLWKKNELFSIEYTGESGEVTFQNVSVADGSGEQIHLTAVKPREQTGSAQTSVAAYLPGETLIEILPAQAPVVSLFDVEVDPTGDGTASPGETAEIFVAAANTGGETASGIAASLSIIQGGEYISAVVNDEITLPDIEPDQTASSAEPFEVEISPYAPAGATVEFMVLFSFSGGSGSFQRQSPLFLTIQAADYQLTLVNSTADNSSGTTAEIVLSDFLMANTGLGEDPSFSVTVSNLNPPEPFSVNELYSPGIAPNTAFGISGQLTLTVSPEDSVSSWLRDGFDQCCFDVTVESPSGESTARQISVELVDMYQGMTVAPPDELLLTEAGQDYISLTWNHSGEPNAVGYYVYVNGSRVYPLPLPVRQVTLNGLQPGTEFEIGVTAIDVTGRESEQQSIIAATSCPFVAGWPLLLGGSPGAGPAVADIDGDGQNEIIAVSSFGEVYIINRNATFQKLLPPAGYDYDRFLGLAVGDVTGDGRNDIVVACQRKIEVEGQEQVSLLLFKKPAMVWTASEIAVTGVDQELSSTMAGGTPVLFQADNTPELEITLRTRGNNGGTPYLYVWKRSSSENTWENFSGIFPYQLSGGFYDSPSAADFDGDGYEELFTTTYSTGDPGTELLIVDFESGGAASISGHDLYELNTGGYTARAFGTLALTEHNGLIHIAGSAKPESFCSNIKNLFVYTVEKTGSVVVVTPLWQTGWITGNDFYGNMPGPTLANIDVDPDLEVVYSLNGGNYQSEGLVEGYDLSTGVRTFQSEPIPFSPIQGGGGADIRSQIVSGLSSSQGSSTSAVFSGFSTLCTGIDPISSPASIPGFPVYSRDAVWAAPAVCDLNGDGLPELIHIDNSGYAVLLSLDQYSTTENAWRMFQANSARTGFVGQPETAETMDVSMAPAVSAGTEFIRGFHASAEVSITGVTNPRTEQVESSAELSASGIHSEIVPDNRNTEPRPLTITAYINGTEAGSIEIPLMNGTQIVLIPLDCDQTAGNSICVVADPENRYTESDETNNTSLAAAGSSGLTDKVVIASPASLLTINLTLTEQLIGRVAIQVFSLEGRLISQREFAELPAGSHTFSFEKTGNGQVLPAGMYTVRITGLQAGDETRRVIILN